MMIKANRKGFTLVEIMIVVAIIGLLAAIAIPNFVKARERAMTNACIANLKQIEGAIQVWAIDKGKASDATVLTTDLEGDYIKVWPKCANSPYVLAGDFTVADTPVCPNVETMTDHKLPVAEAAE